MAKNKAKETIQQHPGDDPKSATAADDKDHVHHQHGGIIMHCDDSNYEDNSNQVEVNKTQEQHPEHLPEFVPDSAASSSGFDRHQNEILRSMHPMRQEIVGASDDICLDTEHSSVQGINCGQPSHSPSHPFLHSFWIVQLVHIKEFFDTVDPSSSGEIING